MEIKISDRKSISIDAKFVERCLFMILSVASAAVITKYTLPIGKQQVKKLDNELQSVSFESSATAVYVGDSLDIQPKIVPAKNNEELIWEISNDGILAVEDGRITAKAEGKTLLGVRVGDLYATVNVVAKYKPLPPDSTLPPRYYDKLEIANYKYNVGSDYVPENLIEIPKSYAETGWTTMYVTQETFDAYKEMYNAMYAEVQGKMKVISAYRSYARQTELYNNAVEKYIKSGNDSTKARLLALETTQTPGNSEHQLGTTLDVSNNGDTNHEFDETPAGAWLKENAHKYGFIIRYPEDKVDITRIEYEPWHLRYVGVYHATYMYVNNLCLEEYIELQEQSEKEANYYAQNHPASVN